MAFNQSNELDYYLLPERKIMLAQNPNIEFGNLYPVKQIKDLMQSIIKKGSQIRISSF